MNEPQNNSENGLNETQNFPEDRNSQQYQQLETDYDTRNTPPLPDNHLVLPWEQEIHEDAPPLPEGIQAQNTAGECHVI